MITLISGRVIDDESQIHFDDTTYRFYYGGTEDITNDIYRDDKVKLVPDFDVARENRRLSSELGSEKGKGLGDTPLNESTLSILGNQLATDPLGAPLDALTAGVKQVFSNTGFRVIAGLAVAGLVIYLVLRNRE